MKINIALPCYNEEKIIEENVLRLYNFCQQNIKDDWIIVIADNASEDKTSEIGKGLAKIYSQIKYLRLPEKGKGRAIRRSWLDFPANIYVFFDADLSTKIDILRPMIDILQKEEFQGVIGSRYLPDSRVQRSASRLFVSRIYNLLVKTILGINLKDLACGAKAFNHQIIEMVLPDVLNNQWFFDSELVIRAFKKHFQIKEIPADWQEPQGRKSRTSFLKVSLEYLWEMIKLKFRGF